MNSLVCKQVKVLMLHVCNINISTTSEFCLYFYLRLLLYMHSELVYVLLLIYQDMMQKEITM